MPSWQHLLILGIVVILLFGKGRISEMMGDFGKGIKSFKKGLAEDEAPAAPATSAPRIDAAQAEVIDGAKQPDKTV